MSARTLPLLFLNLGGEMLYILDQRLRAQSIPGEKARKGERRAAGAGPAPGAARRGVPRPVRAVRGLSLRPLPG